MGARGVGPGVRGAWGGFLGRPLQSPFARLPALPYSLLDLLYHTPCCLAIPPAVLALGTSAVWSTAHPRRAGALRHGALLTSASAALDFLSAWLVAECCWKGAGFGVKESWAGIPAVVLPCCVTSDTSLNLSLLPFLQNEKLIQ